MSTIIIYGSQYGSTKRYAERLSELTGIDAVAFKDAGDCNGYDRIVYLGALFAGGVLGLKKTAEKLSAEQELIIVTVGLADPNDAENINNIRTSIKTQIPPHFYNEDNIYHLRGAIDYGKLGLMHRMMMSIFHSKVSKMPEEELNAEAKAMLATYGGKFDFVDFSMLEPLISAIAPR